MKGYSFEIGPQVAGDDAPGNLAAWEDRAADAIGAVIASWGFKHNHGRVWTLLFLRGVPLPAPAVGEELGLSKGAVSMVLRELEGWGVIHRVRVRGERAWHFVAENDFMAMVRRVVDQRESKLVAHVSSELAAADAEARAAGDVPDEVLARVSRLKALSGLMQAALTLFMQSGRFDFGGAGKLLTPRAPDDPEEPDDGGSD